MNEQETLETLRNEIAELEKTLDEIYPDWFAETLRQHTDESGSVTAHVCAPIRAAIFKLRQGRCPTAALTRAQNTLA